MPDPFLIYGATGYTGRLIATGAVALGLRPILAGRNQAKLAPLAEQLGVDYRVASLADASAVERVIRDVPLVLHAAGPFSETARPIVDACLRGGVHYLDITGEVSVIEQLAARHDDARRRGIMILPGIGFDVVASDCLTAHVARRLRHMRHLALGMSGLTLAARGSMKTAMEQMGCPTPVRRNGRVMHVPPGALERAFDYGEGPRPSIAVSWGDVASAYYTTGVPNVEVYFETTPILRNALAVSRMFGPLLHTAPWQAWLKLHVDLLMPEGPSEEERRAIQTVIVAEAENGHGVARSRFRAPQAYSFTALSAPAIARRVLDGDFEIGFQTPARVYGADFALSFAGVAREDLE